MKILKENKFSIIFFLTYIIYPMIFMCNWLYWLGDYGCVALAILMVIYETLYVFWLGRKEGISINRAVANGFLYLLFMPNIFWIWYYTDTFFNGYFETAFLSSEVLAEYYGFEAWKYDIYAAILFAITFVPYVIYTSVYFVISNHFNNKKIQSKK